MNNFTGFSDLCIPEARTADLEPIIREAVELGYRNVAIEQRMDVTKGEGASNKHDVVPKAYCLKALKASFGGQIRLLNRLTVIFSEASVSLALNRSTNIRSYNVIAALPTSESSFQYACQTMACDIVTYNGGTIRMRMMRKFYYLAVDRNIAFELKYAPAIVDSSERKATIARAHRYHSYGKSKNVLISSEARNPFQLRSPYDVANLGLIFGLSEEQSKESIRGIPNRILLSAEGRRFGKAGVVIARRIKPAEDSDDYSDSELEEDVNEDDNEVEGSIREEDIDDGNNTDEEDDAEKVQPPKKIARHEQ
ncbi:ribonuclease P protein subunit p30 isoform X1 [Anopheles moucheti]|uniref:ribonuclease P protein subunit p30 isoform X1 n=2 Tax=Anopheles moucheti TaxID=186751 RepID=UPI0022F03358|nr:ribonuclease P protein subunit p30 isoform X1 [Anopheles moucheti]